MRLLLAVAAVCAACGGGPSDAELTRLHDEAVRANSERAAHTKDSSDLGFTLNVSGQIAKPSATLDWRALQAMATTHVQTINIQNPDKKTPTDFRGVLASDLLDSFGALPAATEVTFVAIDGFRSTVQLADLRKYRVLLAVEADGKPIDRTAGGPIFLIFPFSEAPELAPKYPDRFWAFYVTHVVIGTEEPHVRIAGKTLDRATLDKLPQIAWDGPVGWKVEWPAEAVHLRGTALLDAIAAAGVTLPKTGKLVIHGKAPIHDDPDKPMAIAIDDLEKCRPILALHWGNDEKPIPAKLGGPVALAITPCGPESDKLWVTFVERIEVSP